MTPTQPSTPGELNGDSDEAMAIAEAMLRGVDRQTADPPQWAPRLPDETIIATGEAFDGFRTTD